MGAAPEPQRVGNLIRPARLRVVGLQEPDPAGIEDISRGSIQGPPGEAGRSAPWKGAADLTDGFCIHSALHFVLARWLGSAQGAFIASSAALLVRKPTNAEGGLNAALYFYTSTRLFM